MPTSDVASAGVNLFKNFANGVPAPFCGDENAGIEEYSSELVWFRGSLAIS